MNKTKIEWTDYSWNPIKGLCPVKCWYCYARSLYKRFKWDPELAIEYSLFEIYKKEWPKKPSKIFVCSTIEMFHPEIPEDWRDEIFETIKEFPQHTFQILTKLPQNIDRPMPDNVWLGVTIDSFDEEEIERSWGLVDAKAKTKFISFEPLLENPRINHIYIFDWVIVGRLTGKFKDLDVDCFYPKRRWIEEIVEIYQKYGIPIFLKDNLKEIWGEPLIQEFPG